MDIVWRRSAVSAEDVGQDLGGKLTNATVRTILRRVEQKGFITHRQDGRAFIYVPRVDPDTVARGVVRRLVDRFYGGSVEQLVLGLVDGKMIDKRVLNRLARQVSAAGTGTKSRRDGR
jgi:predicted transcriptional regulator